MNTDLRLALVSELARVAAPTVTYGPYCSSPHHTAVLRRTAYTARSAADFVERTAAQHWSIVSILHTQLVPLAGR